MSKLIIDIPDELYKDLKHTAIELDTSLKVVVQSIIGIDDNSITNYQEKN